MAKTLSAGMTLAEASECVEIEREADERGGRRMIVNAEHVATVYRRGSAWELWFGADPVDRKTLGECRQMVGEGCLAAAYQTTRAEIA